MKEFRSLSCFSLLNVDCIHLNKTWNYRNITSPFYRLYLIDDGVGTLYTSSRSHKLEKGYLYLIPSFTTCNYCCEEYLHQYYLHFTEESADGTSLFLWNRRIFKVRSDQTDVANFKRLLKLNPRRGLVKSENPRAYEKGPILKGYQELNNLLPVSAFVETQGIILQLLARFLGSDQYQFDKKNVLPSKVSNAIQHIQTNLHQKITVEGLAAMSSQSSDHFSRVFTEHMGERPLAYAQLKRIERAQFLITTTDMSLTEIAGQTGFETISYFSRVFKKVTGQSPSEYKKSSRAV